VSLLLLIALLARSGESPHLSQPSKLPTALEERARMLTAAWLKGDVVVLLKLVEPARDRELRRWLARQPVPTPLPELEAGQLHVAIRSREQNHALVVSSLASADGAGKATRLLSTRWSRRGDHWYFVPSDAVLPRLPSKAGHPGRRPG
jgi:hypothetical protein